MFSSIVWQDFELWDDVGLNIPKPPDLLQLYRSCGSALPSTRDMVDIAVGVELGDLPGNYVTQDPQKKPDLLQKVCVWVRLKGSAISSMIMSPMTGRVLLKKQPSAMAGRYTVF